MAKLQALVSRCNFLPSTEALLGWKMRHKRFILLKFATDKDTGASCRDMPLACFNACRVRDSHDGESCHDLETSNNNTNGQWGNMPKACPYKSEKQTIDDAYVYIQHTSPDGCRNPFLWLRSAAPSVATAMGSCRGRVRFHYPEARMAVQ